MFNEPLPSDNVPHDAQIGQKFKTTATNVYRGEAFCYPEGSIVVFLGMKHTQVGPWGYMVPVFRYEGEDMDRIFDDEELEPINDGN